MDLGTWIREFIWHAWLANTEHHFRKRFETQDHLAAGLGLWVSAPVHSGLAPRDLVTHGDTWLDPIAMIRWFGSHGMQFTKNIRTY